MKVKTRFVLITFVEIEQQTYHIPIGLVLSKTNQAYSVFTAGLLDKNLEGTQRTHQYGQCS